MSRTSKQYERLEQVQAELYSLIRQHLEAESAGRQSLYLIRQLGFPGWTSKSVCDTETDVVEGVEKEVVGLRQKLGEPLNGGPLAIIVEYVRLHRQNSGGGALTDRGIANRLLESDLWPATRRL